jgi:SlyX protein
MEERIIRLEERYTHQQALLQDLSDVLFAQQKTIDQLRAEVDYLKQRLQAFEPGMVDANANERPPHY